MLPPGIGFNALSPKALDAMKTARLPRSYFAWDEMIEMNKSGYWPSTPNTNLLYGLSEALDMILGEGLPNVFAAAPALGDRRARGGDRLGPADPVRGTRPFIRRC